MALNQNLSKIIYDFISFPNEIIPENIEIEARFGKITSKIINERVNLNSLHPIIFEKLPQEWSFNATVNEFDFLKLKNYLSATNNLSNSTNNTKDLSLFFDNSTVKIVSENDKIMLSEGIRKIEKSDGTVKYEIKKLKKSLTIYMPQKKYDLRISVAEETPIEYKKTFNAKILRKREKESYFYKDYVFDLKTVNSSKEKKSEVEIEIVNQKYKKEEFLLLINNLLNKF